MAIIAKQNSGSNIPAIEPDLYQAVCYGVIDIGTQQTVYMGQPKHIRQVVLLFEIPELRIDVERDGKKVNLPRATSKKYTLSLSDKSRLYKDLTSWRGIPFTDEQLKGFDITAVLGANCLIQMIPYEKDGKKMTVPDTITKLKKGMPKHEAENPLVKYSIDDDKTNIPASLPDWIKELIGKSEELTAMKKAAANPDIDKARNNQLSDFDEFIDQQEHQPIDDNDIPF